MNERTLDWVYRNIEGAVVKRRTHQTLEVPPILGQEAYQTMISLSIEESSGYGDRAGGKNERYIQLLKDDLAELPDDPRTLYYLGFAHFDIFNKHQDNPTPADWATLEDSVRYYRRRVDIADKGYYEERYFAMIKLGEIFERFYKNITEAVKYYKMATVLDGERADAWFYWGQIYRLNKEYDKAFDPLLRAASTPLPVRALFQWRYLYDCLAPIELARTVVFHRNPTPAMWASALPLMKKGANGCKGSEQAEIEADVRLIENKLGTQGSSLPSSPRNKAPSFSSLPSVLADIAEFSKKFPLLEKQFAEKGETALLAQILDAFGPLMRMCRLPDSVRCHDFRLGTKSLLQEWPRIQSSLDRVVGADIYRWQTLIDTIRKTCR